MKKDKFGLNKIVQSSNNLSNNKNEEIQKEENSKNTRCTFVMDSSTHRKLKISSVHTGITMSNILKEAIDLYFLKHPERLIDQ